MTRDQFNRELDEIAQAADTFRRIINGHKEKGGGDAVAVQHIPETLGLISKLARILKERTAP